MQMSSLLGITQDKLVKEVDLSYFSAMLKKKLTYQNIIAVA